jgi:hypothetical protein
MPSDKKLRGAQLKKGEFEELLLLLFDNDHG